uniref:Potassium voltage-gated channel subfamily H member 2 n=1 Tax=Macrostomum lignano TaxID=282301 RepID=A0A1I8JPI6_9PLAT
MENPGWSGSPLAQENPSAGGQLRSASAAPELVTRALWFTRPRPAPPATLGQRVLMLAGEGRTDRLPDVQPAGGDGGGGGGGRRRRPVHVRGRPDSSRTTRCSRCAQVGGSDYVQRSLGRLNFPSREKRADNAIRKARKKLRRDVYFRESDFSKRLRLLRHRSHAGNLARCLDQQPATEWPQQPQRSLTPAADFRGANFFVRDESPMPDSGLVCSTSASADRRDDSEDSGSDGQSEGDPKASSSEAAALAAAAAVVGGSMQSDEHENVLAQAQYQARQTFPRALIVESTAKRAKTSAFQVLWDWVILMLVLYTAVFTPYTAAFLLNEDKTKMKLNEDSKTRSSVSQSNHPDPLVIIDLIVDVTFIADILINFRTTYVHNGEVISDPQKIALNYMKGELRQRRSSTAIDPAIDPADLLVPLDPIAAIPFDCCCSAAARHDDHATTLAAWTPPGEDIHTSRSWRTRPTGIVTGRARHSEQVHHRACYFTFHLPQTSIVSVTFSPNDKRREDLHDIRHMLIVLADAVRHLRQQLLEYTNGLDTNVVLKDIP